MKISHQDDASESNIHGHDVLRISELFAKLCTILKIAPVTHEDENGHLPSVLEDYTNIFNPCSTSSQDHTIDEDVSVWTDNRRKVDSKDLVFLWGFRGGMFARTLKKLLHDSRDVFSEEFDVQQLDKSYLDVFKVRMKKGKALSCNHGIRGKEVTEIMITRSFCLHQSLLRLWITLTTLTVVHSGCDVTSAARLELLWITLTTLTAVHSGCDITLAARLFTSVARHPARLLGG
ncbi:uncharacterized protein LOC114270072 [Camellia sinensis]|uniref:uncharacterized protein LOC114270072 n=1 Tax=Camellia sinensis TaxID=4442 RepID=UPI0010362D10|nr:uncharacterized protein LOC114270072 [Camellia sinensis]